MKTPWKELFLLFKRERKQFLIFSLLIIVILIIRWTIPYWYPSDDKFLEQIRVELIKNKDTLVKKQFSQNILSAQVEINTIDTSHWQSLGFSKRQSEIILNYKNIIGGFEEIEDLKKVFIVSEEKYQFIEPHIYIDSLSIKKKNKETDKEKPISINPKSEYNLVEFDPNVVSKEDLQAMGFDAKQISNLINYRKSGGVFYKTEDFKRLYTISNEDYDKVSPFIKIVSDYENVKTEEEEVVREILDLNTCDSIELISLHGIGSFYAHLIIQYRNKLGGYHSLSQLYELKKLPHETIESIKGNLHVDPDFELVKMDLNSDNFKGFMKHPYFDYYHTKKLFDYKNKKGKFTSLQQLNEVGFIETDYVEKILPYLKINK